METLLFVPGLLCGEPLFAPLFPHLEGRARSLVADVTRDDTIGGMARRVLSEAPPRFALCGLSMGGYVALEIMRLAPDRVSRLAILDSQARPVNEAGRKRGRDHLALAERGEFRGITPQLLPLFLHPDRLNDEKLTNEVQAMVGSVGRDAFLRQQKAILARPDSRPQLPGIACQTLVLAGREDAMTPPEVQLEMAMAIPKATLVLLPQCGHLSPMERPEAVATQLLAWLA